MNYLTQASSRSRSAASPQSLSRVASTASSMFTFYTAATERRVEFASGFLFSLCVASLLCVWSESVFAEVNALAYFRMGEADPGAVAGQAGNSTTIDSVGPSSLVLSPGGSSVYSADVAASAFTQTGSTLCLSLAGNSFYSGSSIITSLTDNIGIEGWFRPSVLPAGGFGGGGQALAYLGNTGQNGFGLFIFGNELYGLYGGVQFLPTGRSPSINAWTYFALVRDGGNTSLYVDGTAPISLGGVAPAAASSGLKIGSNGVGEFFGGYADEVRVFSFAPGQFSTGDLLIAVPEPSTYAMALAGLAYGGLSMWRQRKRVLVSRAFILTLALSILFYRSSCAGEIYLSDFSGTESVVDGSGFRVGTIAPGVRMSGGKEGTIFYWSGNSSYWPQSSDYPFSSSPTDGDPNGFSGASGTGYLSTFLPFGLTFSFSEMVQRPNRVGLLAANFGSAPYYDKLGVSLTLEGGGSSYYEYGSGRRLLAFQEEVGIVEMNLRWSPGISYGDGPRISVDDLRYETVAIPEPSAFALVTAGVGGCVGFSMWRRRNRA